MSGGPPAACGAIPKICRAKKKTRIARLSTKTRTVVTYEEIEKEIENSTPQNLDISGTKGSAITLKADYDTVRNLYCSIQSPQSSNSPVTTHTVQFASFSNLANKNLYLQ